MPQLKGAPLKEAPLKGAHSRWFPLKEAPLRGSHSKGLAPKGGPHIRWLPLKKALVLMLETSKRDPLCMCWDPLNGEKHKAPTHSGPTQGVPHSRGPT
jgi:hypothetical protein